jgi:hypothetical protein
VLTSKNCKYKANYKINFTSEYSCFGITDICKTIFKRIYEKVCPCSGIANVFKNIFKITLTLNQKLLKRFCPCFGRIDIFMLIFVERREINIIYFHAKYIWISHSMDIVNKKKASKKAFMSSKKFLRKWLKLCEKKGRVKDKTEEKLPGKSFYGVHLHVLSQEKLIITSTEICTNHLLGNNSPNLGNKIVRHLQIVSKMLSKNKYNGILWLLQQIYLSAVVAQKNSLGHDLSLPALGVIPRTGGFPIILIKGGFVCFLKTFTKMLIIKDSIKFILGLIEREWGGWSLSSCDDND